MNSTLVQISLPY